MVCMTFIFGKILYFKTALKLFKSWIRSEKNTKKNLQRLTKSTGDW